MGASRANLNETITTDDTTRDWERDNAGRVYGSTAEMDAAPDAYCALPDAESA